MLCDNDLPLTEEFKSVPNPTLLGTGYADYGFSYPSPYSKVSFIPHLVLLPGLTWFD
jgi:hypothetical protein